MTLPLDDRHHSASFSPTPHVTPSQPPQPVFPPLDQQTRSAVDTAAAAYYLNRRPQTLRAWACLENGPLRPIRVHGRLAWPVAEIKRILGVTH
jgi:hypothetical protein